MPRRYGQTGLSSLVNSAKSAYEKQQSINDQMKAYEWDLSAKTAEDYANYADYLATRQKQVQSTDPGKAITFASKLTATQRAYSTNEISRQSLAINYGQGSDSSKLAKIQELARAAYAAGDDNLGQRLELQASTLDIKIKNAAEAGANKAYEALKKGIQQEVTSNDKMLEVAKDLFKRGLLSKGEYLKKEAQLSDQIQRTYQNNFEVDGQGNVIPKNGLKQEDAQALYDKYQGWRRQNGDLIGQGLAQLQYNPNLKQQVVSPDGRKIADSALSGFEQVTTANKRALDAGVQLGSFVGVPTAGNQGNIEAARKTLGVGSSVDTALPITFDAAGNAIQEKAKFNQVFVGNQDKPADQQFAYVVDPNTKLKYLVNKDNTLTPLADTKDGRIATDAQIAEYRRKNFGDGSVMSTIEKQGVKAGAGVAFGGIANDLKRGVLSRLGLGAGSALDKINQLNNMRLQAEAKAKAEAQARAIQMGQEQAAARAAIAQAQAGRAAKVAAAPKNDFWAPAPYRDQPLIANPKNQAENAYNIGSQTGLKIPKLY